MSKHLLPFLLAAALGCGSDPVSFSQPVAINVSIGSSDVVGTAIAVEKNINTATGNPYGTFTNAAVQKLGHSPSRIAITYLALTLLSSPGLAGLEQVFAGNVSVGFKMNGSGTTHAVGVVAGPTGAGPARVDTSFDSTALPAGDKADLVQGSFKIVISGAAAASYAGSPTANLEATFGFVAYP